MTGWSLLRLATRLIVAEILEAKMEDAPGHVRDPKKSWT
jgi:hypothetical protein